MSTQIYYNNILILDNQPTPFVGKQESIIRYGEKWADKTTLTLGGQLTGCAYTDLINAQQNLVNAFNQDFQSFRIDDNSSTIFEKPYTFIRDISFPASPYVGVINYNVTLDLYDEDLFSGVFGVLDPSDEWIIEETVERFINITHNVSARGFNTSSDNSNALQNAIDFVNARTGLNNSVYPYFISVPSGFNPCLKSFASKPNRFNATYGVTETYVADQFFGTDGVLRYTINFDCDENGLAKVGVQGTIDGCGLEADVTAIRARYETIDFYGIASGVYHDITNATGLNPSFLTRNLNEDPYSRKLTFNIIYDNTTGTDVYLDYGVNLDSGEDNITKVTWNGSIKGRGDLRLRWDRVSAFYNTFDPFITANQVYNEFSNGAWPLNPKPLTKGTTFDKFNGQINLNYTWDNKSLPWNGFEDLDYTISLNPALRKIIVNPLLNLCNLEYYIADAGYIQRMGFTVDGHGRLSCALSPGQAQQLAINSINTQVPILRNQYFSGANGILITEEKSLTKGLYDMSFRYRYSANGTEYNP